MSPFLDDGYTIESVIELPGFDSLKIKHRPLVGSELTWLSMDEANRGPGLIARKLADWDLKDAKGEPIKVANAEEALRKLHHAFYAQVLNRIISAGITGDSVKN